MQPAVHLTQRGYLIFLYKTPLVWRVESIVVAVTALATVISPTMFTTFFNSHVTQKDILGIGSTIDIVLHCVANAIFSNIDFPHA